MCKADNLSAIYEHNIQNIMGASTTRNPEDSFILSLWFMCNLVSHNKEVRWVRCSVVVEALCYKPEGLGFETR
jgi:hypothetical protein